jgi:hypothetical protein
MLINDNNGIKEINNNNKEINRLSNSSKVKFIYTFIKKLNSFKICYCLLYIR